MTRFSLRLSMYHLPLPTERAAEGAAGHGPSLGQDERDEGTSKCLLPNPVPALKRCHSLLPFLPILCLLSLCSVSFRAFTVCSLLSLTRHCEKGNADREVDDRTQEVFTSSGRIFERDGKSGDE